MNIMISLFISMIVCIIYMLIRNCITYKYSVYWIDKVLDYQIKCIKNNDKFWVECSDIIEYDEYYWMLFTFNKDKMVKSKQKLEILKNY